MLTFQPWRAVQAAAESLAAVGPEARCESKEFIADSTLEEAPDQQYLQIVFKFSNCKRLVSCSMFHPRFANRASQLGRSRPYHTSEGCY